MMQFSLATHHSLNPLSHWHSMSSTLLSGQQPNNHGYKRNAIYRHLQMARSSVALSPFGVVVPPGQLHRFYCGVLPQGKDFLTSPETPASSSKEPDAYPQTPDILTVSTRATPVTLPPPPVDTDNVPWTPIEKRGGFIATFDKWKRRLITKDDFMHVHAISSSVLLGFLLLNEALLVATVATTGKMWEPENWAVVVIPLCMAVIVSQLSSIVLAIQFRYGAARRAFIGSAIVNLNSVVLSLVGTECWPQALTFSTTPLPSLTFALVNLAVLYQSFVDMDPMLQSRRITWSTGPGHVSILQGRILYILPVALGPLIELIGLKLFLAHSPTWAATFQQHHPEYYPFLFQLACHFMLLGVLPPLAVTLRDKKLIRPRLEMALTSTPVLIPLAFTTWAWNKHSDWVPDFFISLVHLTSSPPI